MIKILFLNEKHRKIVSLLGKKFSHDILKKIIIIKVDNNRISEISWNNNGSLGFPTIKSL